MSACYYLLFKEPLLHDMPLQHQQQHHHHHACLVLHLQ